MNSLSKRFSPHRPERNPGKNVTGRRNRREVFNPEQLTIIPVPREELPDEMRSVLESFISSSQRPSLADVRLNCQADAQLASTSGRTQSQGSSTRGYDRYEYDGRNDDEVHGPNAKWPFNFTFGGKKFPPRVYHTHKVASRSRPGAKKQLGKRKWHPSKRHGRVIRQEDYDAYAADGLGRTTQVLKSESLLDLSVRGGRAAKGIIGRIIRASRLWRWPRGRESSESEQVARGTFCRG